MANPGGDGGAELGRASANLAETDEIARRIQPLIEDRAILGLKLALSVQETAQLLSLGRSAVLVLVQREKFPLPSFRFGKRIIIPRKELVQWLGDEAERSSRSGGS